MNKEKFKKIIEDHQHFLNEDIDGWEDLRADLTGEDLHCVNLKGVNLSWAYLENANLNGANLQEANLTCAKLNYAKLRHAKLNYANLDKKEKFRKGVILSKSIIGWKKCMNNIIVKLEIPKGAIVFCINGKKCRTNKAKVLSISRDRIARSIHDNSFTYRVGEEIEIKDFNLMYNIECGNGIHFFKYKKDARKY